MLPHQVNKNITIKVTHKCSNEPVVTFELSKDFPHQAREGQLGNEVAPRLLVVTDLLQGTHSRVKPVFANSGVLRFADLHKKLGVSNKINQV